MNQLTSFALAAATTLVAACGGGSEASATVACTELATARLAIPNLQVASAVEVAASGALPAHCKVNGALNGRTGIDGKPYAIGFELRTPLPAAWNGKFFFQGGGGTNGVIVPATGNLLNAPSGTVTTGAKLACSLRCGQPALAICTRGGNLAGSVAW